MYWVCRLALGITFGTANGSSLGDAIGIADSAKLSTANGAVLGLTLGALDGNELGTTLGTPDDMSLGDVLSIADGATLDTADGTALGSTLGTAENVTGYRTWVDVQSPSEREGIKSAVDHVGDHLREANAK